MIGVSISKEMRGQGLGTELIEKSLQALANENIEEVELTVDATNVAANGYRSLLSGNRWHFYVFEWLSLGYPSLVTFINILEKNF
ncbi:Acetyltransferase (GNAT) family protein [Desulfosporosinus lacus DSM 15449]|uniref:Acetyltransferase (GNAT) family protein n=1 Tax=Desulfosporosinus lacus DSM 15449 TaxID=1121420 RepID=A0A1M5ZI58_9FIRM|nr:Acetyltransferase (GNAT) family protein [Desulfosporosinus lacus DSM 15449]